jgi:hypothetical protein
MPLVKSPILTPVKLAANCANARKSTGPRTAAGKRHIVLNALKHGRCSRGFRENLVKAGADAELFDWIRARVFDCFRPLSTLEHRQAERLAREVWCEAWRASRERRQRLQGRVHLSEDRLRRARAPSKGTVWCLAWTPWRLGGLETKPRYALKSTDSSVTLLSRIQIVDVRNGRRLAFWVRRRRGTGPQRIPVRLYPEVAAWLLRQQAGLSVAREASPQVEEIAAARDSPERTPPVRATFVIY